MIAKHLKISDGPGKSDLIFALFDGKQVFFTVETIGKIEVVLTSVGIEDGSRQSWLIRGWIVGEGSPEERKFSGYFETRNRHGHIDMPPK